MQLPSAVKLAGVLYTPDTRNRGLLRDFAEQMKARCWHVGGLVQDVLENEDGSRRGIEAVALDTMERVLIAGGTSDPGTKACTLNHSALLNSNSILRRAIENRVDLMLVEKFGEQEQSGGGLMGEILRAVAAGIPVVVSVPAQALEKWRQFSGGLGVLLPSDLRALNRWWGAQNAIEELARNVCDETAKRVVVGTNWTLVEGPSGCGLAHSPARGTAGCRSIADAGEFNRKPLKALAALAGSWNPFEAAIGMAAINSHFNRYDLQGESLNGLQVFEDVQGTVTCIGRFPGLGDRYPNLQVIELEPEDDEYPEAATERVVDCSDAVLITSSALVNGSFQRIMNARGEQTRVALVGPGTPLSPALFHYGVDTLSGLVVEDVDPVADIVAQGGAVKKMKQFCRYVTVKKRDC